MPPSGSGALAGAAGVAARSRSCSSVPSRRPEAPARAPARAQEDPAAPPGRLGEDRDGLAPAEHGVGRGAAERGESTALAGLKQDHHLEEQRVEDEQREQKREHLGLLGSREV